MSTIKNLVTITCDLVLALLSTAPTQFYQPNFSHMTGTVFRHFPSATRWIVSHVDIIKRNTSFVTFFFKEKKNINIHKN